MSTAGVHSNRRWVSGAESCTEGRKARRWVAIPLLVTVPLVGCAQAEPWWGDRISADPCSLDVRSAVEGALGNRQVTEEALELDTGHHCAFSLGGDHDDVRIRVFGPVPSDAEWVANLDDTSLWTPLVGVGDAAGYQSYSSNGTAQVFMQSVESDVGVSIDVVTEGSIEHGVDVAEQVGNEVLDRVERRRRGELVPDARGLHMSTTEPGQSSS